MSSTITQRMTGAGAAIAALAAHGVDTIFGIPGGHSLPIYDALARQQAIRHILGRHEQGLGFMADGYARASGRVGVLTTTSGPAVANLACALGQATTDTSPVLAIASTVRSELVGKNRGGLHDLSEGVEIMRPVCRHVRRCMSAVEIPATIAELLHLLQTERPGAVFVEIPCDVLGGEAEIEIAEPLPCMRKQADPAALTEAARLLSRAERPLLWVGTGALNSGAAEEVDALARKLGALVVPTTLGRSILPSAHPHVMMPDGALKTAVSEVMAAADVTLAVGTMFKQEDTADWQARPGGVLIHIDIDLAEIGRSFTPEIGIAADAKAALAALLPLIERKSPASPEWTARGKAAEAERMARRWAQGPLEMGLLHDLRAVLPDDGILACDRCNLGYWAYRCFPVTQPRTFFYPMGYGGLGGALPQAFGAKLACPERAVVAVIGDGGFHFTGMELSVAVQEGIPVTVILCNNQAYGAIRANQDRNFAGRRFGSDLWNPDYGTLAAAFGIPYTRVTEAAAFKPALTEAVGSGKMRIIELAIDLQDS